jgi:MFS family permease
VDAVDGDRLAGPRPVQQRFIVGLVAASGVNLLFRHAGVLVDRSDKKKLVTYAQFLLGVEAVLLWYLTVTGRVTVASLIALSFYGGAIASVEIPARQALMIDLVGRDDLRDAIALNSSGFNLARIIGPAIGAFIIANLGLAWCFAANAISYVTVLIGLGRVRLPPWQAPRMPGAPLQQIGKGSTARQRPVRRSSGWSPSSRCWAFPTSRSCPSWRATGLAWAPADTA